MSAYQKKRVEYELYASKDSAEDGARYARKRGVTAGVAKVVNSHEWVLVTKKKSASRARKRARARMRRR